MSKLLHLAPIVITTAGVTALISLRVDDPRFKSILRMVAVVLFFGSIATVASEAIKLVEQGAEAQRVIAEQQRRVQEELAKAAEASARAKQAEEIAKQAALRAQEAEQAAKLKADELERQARLRAERDEQVRLQEAEKSKRAQLIRDEQERQRQREVREAEHASQARWCESCCTRAYEKQIAPNSLAGYVNGCVAYCLRPGPGEAWQRALQAGHCKAG